MIAYKFFDFHISFEAVLFHKITKECVYFEAALLPHRQRRPGLQVPGLGSRYLARDRCLWSGSQGGNDSPRPSGIQMVRGRHLIRQHRRHSQGAHRRKHWGVLRWNLRRGYTCSSSPSRYLSLRSRSPAGVLREPALVDLCFVFGITDGLAQLTTFVYSTATL